MASKTIGIRGDRNKFWYGDLLTFAVWGSISVSLWARGLSWAGPGILCSLSVDEDEEDEDPGLWPGLPRARMTAGFYFPLDWTIIPLSRSSAQTISTVLRRLYSYAVIITDEILTRVYYRGKQPQMLVNFTWINLQHRALHASSTKCWRAARYHRWLTIRVKDKIFISRRRIKRVFYGAR